MIDRAEGYRIAKLVRVSTTHLEQADSPQHQTAYIMGEAARAGWADTGLTYHAELTGAVIVDRPDIQRMLRDARDGLFDAIVLKSISRLGRDVLGLLMVKRMLDDLGIELVALADGYRSLRDPELIFLVHAERAQAGRQEIAKNVRAGIVEAARRGIWPAGTLPFGLRKQGRFAIEVDPETGPLVQLIFALRRQRWGLPKICQHLNTELRVKGPAWWHLRAQIQRLEAEAGAGQDERIGQRLRHLRERLLTGRFVWSPRTLRLMLANTAYHGELRYNRTVGQRKMHGRLVRESKGQAEWVSIRCAPLLPMAEWEEVQGMREERRRIPARAHASPFLLSGLVRCGQCGFTMRGATARTNSGKRGGDPKGYYVCRGGNESGLHAGRSIRATELEGAVVERLRVELAGLQLPAMQPVAGERRRDPEQEIAQIAEQLRDLCEARFYRREERRKGRITDADLAFDMAMIERKEQALRESLQQIEQVEVQDEGSQLQAMRRVAMGLLRLDGPAEAVRVLLTTLIRKIVVHAPDHIEIHTAFAQEELG